MAASGYGIGLICLTAMLGCGVQTAQADCNQPAAEPVTHVTLPGHPFAAIPTRDGCTIFVSLSATRDSHIVVLRRDGGTVVLLHDNASVGLLTGMALSPDGRYLAAARPTGATPTETFATMASPEALTSLDASNTSSILSALALT